MKVDYLDVFFAVFPLFLLGLLGFLFRKRKKLSAQSDETLSWLVINLMAPCLIVDSFLGNIKLENLETLIVAPVLGFSTVLIGICLCRFVGKFFHVVKREQQGTFDIVVSLYNYGYIPIPIILLFFGVQVLGMLFLYNVGVEIAVWTIAVFELSGHTSWKETVKRCLSPPIIALASSMLANFYFVINPLPISVIRIIHMVGQGTIPVALLLVGAMVYDHFSAVKSFFPARPVVVGVVLRLFCIPATFIAMAFMLPIDEDLKKVLCVQAGMPSAVLPMVLIKQYGGDMQLAIRVILATSIVCLVTLPLWLSLFL